jgi:hypothetical protein
VEQKRKIKGISMNFKEILSDSVQNFILSNINEDTASLAMKMKGYEAELKLEILDQIKARQKAYSKLPTWVRTNNIIFPSPNLIEQSSSEATASYKSHIINPGQSFVDLTAGTGNDSTYISEKFDSGLCIELDTTTAMILEHNLKCFNNNKLKVLNMNAEKFLADNKKTYDLIYIDPQRRNDTEKNILSLEKCSPNIIQLLPKLIKCTKQILLKASPVLDISGTCQSLKHVKEVHVVELNNECKEVLYLLDTSYSDAYKLISVILNSKGDINYKMVYSPQIERELEATISAPKKYIYEPCPSVMKAGAFNSFGKQFKLDKLHKNTHLYTSNIYLENFPGKVFELLDVFPVDKKIIKQKLPNKLCDISVRNFPSTPQKLYKSLGFKQGNDAKLFACTMINDRHVMLHVRPMQKV